MVRFMLGALAIGGALLLSGCTDLVTGGDLIRPGQATGLIEVVNNSGETLSAVLISDCNVGSYGLNRLPDGVTIPHGGSYAFQVSAGCWDVDAGNDGGEARQRMDVVANGVVEYTVN